MKVTIISTMEGYPWGGSEELWYRVAKKLLEKGSKVQICIKSWPNKHQKIKNLENLGANILLRKPVSIANRLLNRIGYKLPSVFLTSIKSFNPEYILISQGATFDFFQNHQLHSYIQSEKVDYSIISQFNYENGFILDERTKVRLIKSRPWHFFYFVSKRNLDSAIRQCGIKLQNTKIIANPVNINNFEIAPWPKFKTLHIACVARYSCNFKGQDLLLEALSDPVFYQQDFKLSFYGEGEHKEHIKQLIKLYSLEKKVFVYGNSNNIDSIWENNHILFLPSLAEGMPLTLQEAMFKGRTALVCDVGDCDSLIDKNNGFIIPFATKKLLKEAISLIFSKSLSELEHLGKIAHQTASKKINKSSHIEIINDLNNVSK